MVLNSRKLGCIYTESWDVCLNLPFEISIPVILDSLSVIQREGRGDRGYGQCFFELRRIR